MAKQITSRKRAKAYSLVLFLIGLGIIFYLDAWWPELMLVIGLPLALRQYLLGRRYDVCISLFVFLGIYITEKFKVSWEILLPVLFTVGGLYIFFREYLESSADPEDVREADLNEEIKEDTKK